jgi:hypothetical protein
MGITGKPGPLSTILRLCHPSATPTEHNQSGSFEHGSDSGEGAGSAGSDLDDGIADAGIVPDSELEVGREYGPQSRFVDIADDLEEGVMCGDLAWVGESWAVEFDEHGWVVRYSGHVFKVVPN